MGLGRKRCTDHNMVIRVRRDTWQWSRPDQNNQLRIEIDKLIN